VESLFTESLHISDFVQTQNEAKILTGVINGVPTSPRRPRLSHLLFADDSLMFCKANYVEWRRLMKILEVYEASSGQKINLQKTSIFFSRNTSMMRKQEIISLSVKINNDF
jgi:hypothetical protein